MSFLYLAYETPVLYWFNGVISNTGWSPSFKPLCCLHISCWALCCFTLQIHPCLHLLLTDNSHYGLPWVITQVTNQLSQGLIVSKKKRKCQPRRAEGRRHDSTGSTLSLNLCVTPFFAEGRSQKQAEPRAGKRWRLFARTDEINSCVASITLPGGCSSATCGLKPQRR